ncbi:YIP1 family protein [Haloarculaceae archaeon H-GB2-1]|nr:YIP1 family protein [Haloarculaceae archaeon H-GB1-1]MEA5387505.1 YIP1 family protein [Haloarculaceae archaeon H-GB11]MEA5408987.1 YIP1 family protein [Haloarculaceae archaeon H-GB2-1]
MAATDILFDPESYYATKRTEVTVREPAFLLLVIIGSGVLTAGIQTQTVTETTAATGSTVILVGASSVLAAVFAPVLSLVGYSVLMFALARLQGGVGGFRLTLKLVGLGFLPKVLGSLCVLGGTFVALQSIPAGIETTTEFVNRLEAHPARRVSRTLNTVFLVWSGFLWIFAVKSAHEIDLRRAAVTAGLPTLAGIGLGVASLL